MPDINTLKSALIKADAAGNVEDAKILADEIRRQASGSQELNYGDMMKESAQNVMGGFLKGGLHGGGSALLGEVVGNLTDVMDRGAYKTGGMVTDTLAPHVPPEVAGGAGYLANVGVQAIPTTLGAGAGKGILETPTKWLGKRGMHSALMPSKADVLSGKADEAVQYLLDKHHLITRGSATKIAKLKSALGKKIQTTLDDLPGSISKDDALDEVTKLLDKELKQATPAADINNITKAWDEFDLTHPDKIPLGRANEIKKGTYRSIGDKPYGSGEVSSGSVKGQQAIASGLRKGIEKEAARHGAPNIANDNAELGRMIDVLKQINPRVGMEANKDIVGIAALATNPAAATAMQLDRWAAIKSLIAQGAYHGGGPAGTALGGTAGALYGLLHD